MNDAIGIVGLGLVGRALADRLSGSGAALRGCDPSMEAASAAAAAGIAIDPDVAALAARSDVLIVCVLDDAQLASVLAALPVRPPLPRLLVNAATCSAQAADAAAGALLERGIALIELPFSGSSEQIRAGEALALLGATEPDRQRFAPLLERIAPRACWVGAPGAAARAKLASNLVLGLNRAALAEGLALAAALGLDADRFLALLRDSPAYSRAVDTAGARMVERRFDPPVSRLRQHRKDLRLIVDAAVRAGLDLPLASAHAGLLDRAIDAGLGDLDNAALIAALDPQRFAPRR
ncbi:MAG TPA: NAD-binding protein [Burkholderiaceae bacterium]|nr:NAD-binding protein [Burkholderiaceae bacterium]